MTGISAYFRFFDGVARAVALYGAQVWGCYQSIQLERVQYFFIRKLLNLPNWTPVHMLLLECGRFRLFLSTLRIHLNFVERVMFDHREFRLTRLCLAEAIESGFF